MPRLRRTALPAPSQATVYDAVQVRSCAPLRTRTDTPVGSRPGDDFVLEQDLAARRPSRHVEEHGLEAVLREVRDGDGTQRQPRRNAAVVFP